MQKNPFCSIPGSGGVILVGYGYQAEDHYGLKDATLREMSHIDYHTGFLSVEEIENGQARFNTFHFDGIIYGAHPSRVTAFRCVRSPKGPELTIQWDDGTEGIMQCHPGSTAFISSVQLYNVLTHEEKKIADLSFWEPAPYAFAWSVSRRFRSSGFGLAPGGKTISLDELPDWTSDKVFKYPIVWLNPITGEKRFQIMAEIVRKVYFKDPPHEAEKIVEDEEGIRVWLNRIFDRLARPGCIVIPRTEGDMVVWNNWVLSQLLILH
jgi:hypothetical protein